MIHQPSVLSTFSTSLQLRMWGGRGGTSTVQMCHVSSAADEKAYPIHYGTSTLYLIRPPCYSHGYVPSTASTEHDCTEITVFLKSAQYLNARRRSVAAHQGVRSTGYSATSMYIQAQGDVCEASAPTRIPQRSLQSEHAPRPPPTKPQKPQKPQSRTGEWPNPMWRGDGEKDKGTGKEAHGISGHLGSLTAPWRRTALPFRAKTTTAAPESIAS